MSRTKSSSQWLQEHFSDDYVKRSWQDGLRSRAAYKLKEIQMKDKLIMPGDIVVDLGAAPGGFSQLASHYVGKRGCVIALDILPMDSLANVDFIQGDFMDDAIYDVLINRLSGRKINVILSDIAPNLSGIAAVDLPKCYYILKAIRMFCMDWLEKDGNILLKVFQGEGFDEYLKSMRQLFNKVTMRKPAASRSRSREMYLLGSGFKGTDN